MPQALNQSGASSFSPMQVIGEAARATGADFDFLVRTAARESNFDAGARARTSSAAGMFQFIEQTWLAMMARYGDQHGYGEMASAVRENAAGRYVVDDPQMRERILEMRYDPQAASVMAGELASENASFLRAATGREPSSGELYAAHFLGARGAARLINTAAQNPEARADRMFPAAASANRSIFYASGQPRTVSEVLGNLTRQGSGAQAPEAMPLSRSAASTRTEPSERPEGLRLASADESRERRPAGMSGYAAGGRTSAVLAPGVVEILASLHAPERASRKG
ncbi:hypothetical protein FKB34_06785 [Glycocaulis profundi]|nr:hypothetical protein FKB34_06785 [Glycocaulis profundi]